MKKKYFLSFFALIFFFCSFAQKKVTISGKLNNNTNYTSIYLDNVLTESEVAASKIDDKGNFSFEIQISKSDFYKLKLDKNTFIFLLPKPGEIIYVNLDLANIQKPIITGSKNSSLLYKALQKNNSYDDKLDKITQEINEQKKAEIRKMIQENPRSLACIFFVQNLDINQDYKTYKLLAEGLAPYKGNALVDEIINKVSAASSVTIGTQVPEIKLNTPEGKLVTLSSLRGKVVILDFWASWCKPCREQNPFLLKIYNKYHEKGLEIYSVSLDATKEDWVSAIKKDSIGAWIHVSDLKYSDSQAAKTYNVTVIPYTLLIDKEGKLIAKELNNTELEFKIKLLLNAK